MMSRDRTKCVQNPDKMPRPGLSEKRTNWGIPTPPLGGGGVSLSVLSPKKSLSVRWTWANFGQGELTRSGNSDTVAADLGRGDRTMSAEDVVAKLVDGAKIAVARDVMEKAIPVALAGSSAMWRAAEGDPGLMHLATCRLMAAAAAALATATDATWEQAEHATLQIVRGLIRSMREAADDPR